MKFLFLHNKYLIQGGEDVSTQAEINLLKENGHFVDAIFINNDNIQHQNKILLAKNTVWSSFYYNYVIDLIERNNYDIIHVQNFFPQFSPSIFYAAHKKGAKIVMSIRNYRLICPNALLYRNGQNCNLCVGKAVPYPALIHKCYKNSILATTVSASMLAFHNIANTWTTKVDGFIAISSFVKEQLVSGGLPEDKIFVKHNFVANLSSFNITCNDNFIYVGRLSTEKGINILLEAFKSKELANSTLNIIGDGPLVDDVVRATEINNNVNYLGRLNLEDTYRHIANSRALIFPSQWHEPFGRTIIEAFSCRTPVIGSTVGGVTELITDGFNGYLFDPLSKEDLINKVLRIKNNDSNFLRDNAYSTYLSKFSSEVNYKSIMDIYQNLLAI